MANEKQHFTFEQVQEIVLGALNEIGSKRSPSSPPLDRPTLEKKFEELGFDSFSLTEASMKIEENLKISMDGELYKNDTPNTFVTGVVKGLERAGYTVSSPS